MNLEDTIRECLASYPDIFRCREDVLLHLFWTYGNGYDWVRGQLVYACDDATQDGPAPVDLDLRCLPGFPTDRPATLASVVSEYMKPSLPFGVLAEVPDDIAPDFLAGIQETFSFLESICSHPVPTPGPWTPDPEFAYESIWHAQDLVQEISESQGVLVPRDHGPWEPPCRQRWRQELEDFPRLEAARLEVLDAVTVWRQRLEESAKITVTNPSGGVPPDAVHDMHRILRRI